MKHTYWLPILFLLIFTSQSSANETNVPLPATCYAVPKQLGSLCIVETYSPIMPVNDVVFYRRNEFGNFVLLEAIKGDVANVSVAGFSTGGKFTIIVYAEEGHPSFVIYLTEEFLSSERPLKPYAVISNYFITRIATLDDNGNAIVELLDSTDDIDEKQACLPSEVLPPNSDPAQCHIRYNINDVVLNKQK